MPEDPFAHPTTLLSPLDVLYESSRAVGHDLPGQLLGLYGGPLGLSSHTVYANFVASLDGVVALPGVPRSNKLISMGSEADRFVMGLLRATADVVLIGAGTLRQSPRGRWTAEHTYPPAAAGFAELRRSWGLSASPRLAVVTGSGDIDPGHPALEAGSLVLTSARGAATLRDRLAPTSTVVTLGEEVDLDATRVIAELRQRGHERILSEAGPRLFGSLLAAGLVDELFLTQSPVLAGGASPAEAFHLVERTALLPDFRVGGDLLSVRRQAAHLFLRYALTYDSSGA